MTRPIDFSVIKIQGNAVNFLEERRAYSGSNLEYLGYSKIPNASTSESIWFIVKYSYSGSDVIRKQLPDNGTKFSYAWDDRATFFS